MDGIIATKLYTVEEIGAHLGGVSRRTVWRLLESGDLKGRHIGRRWYVLGSDLLNAGTDAKSDPVQVEEPERKRRPLGHELVRNGGAG